MSKEAMKLALEHAKRDERHLNHAETRYWCRMYRDIAEKAVEALAKPDFWEGYVPEPDKRQQALDKKAQNARELGLDYEPAQQEPVAWMQDSIELYVQDRPSEYYTIPLYTSPPVQRTWVGLTEPERLACYDLNPARFASAIEAKLRSKNEDRN
jgi:hypothetical protein